MKKQPAPRLSDRDQLAGTLSVLGERGLLGRLEELTVGSISIKLGAERPIAKPTREVTQEDLDRTMYASSGLTS